MKDKKIQWHPGFIAAINLELAANRNSLTYIKEHNLNIKPLEIDLLVIKNDKDIQIANEIGHLFRGHNILEYKSPQDHLDIDSFYKAEAYAALYKSYGETVDKRKADDITISIIREAKPMGLFRYFKKHYIRVINPYPGIYYVLNEVLFLTQIIVIRELDKKNHTWLKALSNKMDTQSMREFLEQIQTLNEKFDQELADAVLAVSTRANPKTVNELRGDESMYQALMEIMEPEISKIIEERVETAVESAVELAVASAVESAVDSAIESTVASETKKSILSSIKSFRELGVNDEKIKELLIKNYGCTPKRAEAYL